MSTREIPRADWATFLAAFSRQHAHWLVTVDRVRDGSRETIAEDEPLERVITSAGGIMVVIASGEVAVADPTSLRVESEGAVESAIQIEDAEGTATRVDLRTPIAPELVDGVAP
jgi:hypothetical protein